MKPLLILSLITLLLVTLVPRPTNATTLADVEPATGYPGTIFTFSATNLRPGEVASYWLNMPNGAIVSDRTYTVKVQPDSSATWTWTTSTDAMAGTWSMVIEGIQSGISFSIPFTIQDGTIIDPATGHLTIPDQARIGVEPEIGPPGIQFHFFANHFRQYEPVSFWVNSPDGKVYGGDPRIYQTYADAQGLADWYWVSSRTDIPGVWSMVATGHHSNVVQVILFTIE